MNKSDLVKLREAIDLNDDGAKRFLHGFLDLIEEETGSGDQSKEITLNIQYEPMIRLCIGRMGAPGTVCWNIF